MALDEAAVLLVIAEDDEGDYAALRQLMAAVSAPRVRVARAATYESALAAMTRGEHDVYLVASRLDGRDGLTLLQEARAGGCEEPILFLLDGADDDELSAILAAGATGWLVKKQLSASLLAQALRHALARAEAEGRVRRQAAHAEALVRVAARLNARLDLVATLNTVCEETMRALGASAANVYLYDASREHFYHAAGTGLPPNYGRLARAVPLSAYEILVGRAGRPVVIPDVRAAEWLSTDELLAALDVRSLAVTVMERDGNLIGALNVKSVGHVRAFTEEELALLQGIADQATQAISNARLVAAAQRRLQRMEALRMVDRSVLARASLEETLELVLEQSLTHLNVVAAGILLWDEPSGRLERAAVRGFGPGDGAPGSPSLRLGDGYAAQAARERRTVHVYGGARAEDGEVRPTLDGNGPVLYSAAPLVAGDEVRGVLDIYHRQPLAPGEPDSEWAIFLESLAAQAAIAIDNNHFLEETDRLLEATRRQARQVQRIIDTLPEGVMLLDADRRLLQANPVAQEFLPVLAELTGDVVVRLGDRSLSDLLPSPAGGTVWQEVKTVGPARIFQIGAGVIRGGAGVGGWVLVVRDITEVRQQEAYLQSQERLATVGQLAAGIAHDFNNILAIILLYTETLERDPESPERRQFLSTIRQQVQHASELIRQILDFSRGSLVGRRPLDLVPFLKEVVKLLERMVPASIRIELVLESASCRVNGDPARLQQLVMNLGVNARDAMPEGGELTITLGRFQLEPGQPPPVPYMAPGMWVRLTVTDTGTGIASADIPHIFEPFFTTKEGSKGTGLGLAQVYGIARKHGGEITVESGEGEGTTFTLYLPALDEAVASAPGSGEHGAPAAGDEVILVVEDDAATRMAIQDTLVELGYRVLVAGTGREALALFEEHAPAIDLVLSDMVMPEMGGKELYEALRARWPQVRMILMSGYPLRTVEESFADRGGVALLRKPFTAEEIAQILRRVLDAEAPSL